MADEQKIIATAGLIAVSVGTANSIIKYKKPPSTRFLIGSGVAYMVLSAMGNSQALGEIAKGLAVGIMTTIVLGEGGGVMSYFVGKEESDTAKPKKSKTETPKDTGTPRPQLRAVPNPRGQYRRDSITPQPFHPLAVPAVP